MVLHKFSIDVVSSIASYYIAILMAYYADQIFLDMQLRNVAIHVLCVSAFV